MRAEQPENPVHESAKGVTSGPSERTFHQSTAPHVAGDSQPGRGFDPTRGREHGRPWLPPSTSTPPGHRGREQSLLWPSSGPYSGPPRPSRWGPPADVEARVLQRLFGVLLQDRRARADEPRCRVEGHHALHEDHLLREASLAVEQLHSRKGRSWATVAHGKLLWPLATPFANNPRRRRKRAWDPRDGLGSR